MILFGLVLFVYFGDPAGGNENAPNSEWLLAFAVLGAISAACSCSAAAATSR